MESSRPSEIRLEVSYGSSRVCEHDGCRDGQHDLRLVALAGIVCFVTSLVAINVFQRARQTKNRSRWIWIVTAGVAGGCGIWTARFISMLHRQQIGLVTAISEPPTWPCQRRQLR
jgi:NO-binding membrane sensor protein with MHYT domain